MSKMNSFLTQRLKVATEKISKMTGLAEMASQGSLSSFSGVFRVTALSAKEQEELQEILHAYKNEEQDTAKDFQALSALTSEVKAINNQAAILHGERIKKAQEILKKYRDGAFSSWLMTTYGNRQTPYNFLQYYELYTALPQILHPKLDEMPRQAVYILASRSGSLEDKKSIIENYQGEPKQKLVTLIRDTFPLDDQDKRAENLAETAISHLSRLKSLLERRKFKPSEKQKEKLQELLTSLKSIIGS